MYQFPDNPPHRFEILMEISNPEQLTQFENLLVNSDLKDMYCFEMINVDSPTTKCLILYDDECMGAIHGTITSSFLQKIYPHIEQTYNDYVKAKGNILQMQ